MNRLFQQFDIEMEKWGLDTAVVIGESTLGNPELAYVAGTTVPRGGIFVKRRRCNPILVVTNIDVGSAKRGRVKDVRTYSDYGYEKLVERHGRERAYIMLIGSILRSVRARGRVSIYGHNEFSRLLSIADSLRKIGYKVKGERDIALIESLRDIKDSVEVNRIRSVGVQVSRVLGTTLEMLRKCAVRPGKLRSKGKELTVGMVKSWINLLLADRSHQDICHWQGTP